MDHNRHAEAIADEGRADAAFRKLVSDNIDIIRPIAHWGDGRGGYLASVLIEILFGESPREAKAGVRKATIPAALRIAVFERDAYRCVTCGGWVDLCCDHIHPESAGGETTMDNLQTMCRSCNSRKGASIQVKA